MVDKYKDFFKVPVCNLQSIGKTSQTLSVLDYETSINKIGEIVNLSQKLNSIIWDEIHKGTDDEKILTIYEDACKLAVLSGIEIDKAKRSYDNVNVGKELKELRKKYDKPNPTFFKEIDKNNKGSKKEYAFYNTAMDYIFELVSNGISAMVGSSAAFTALFRRGWRMIFLRAKQLNIVIKIKS